ncbi:hypothetical protein AJ79_07551 [Helicocarpus griseus UAMH5409]|uniref:Auxin efflux carrier n=1 Tax=Helicocarpus griseus UAMH5409 TaxID=1447875 RepID=A0A2B7X163_9EURO|nr:hypothetical protein AJ79_07551 [Helicocarpus griseus UAMH5409]
MVFTSPTSLFNANAARHPSAIDHLNVAQQLPALDGMGLFSSAPVAATGASPSIPHLALLVFEAVLEVVCVSLPGYIIARMGMFDAEAQKFIANLNVMLFTPCLVFTKLASQLTADKLTDLAIIPLIFIIQTLVSFLCSRLVSRVFRFKKRQSNFVTAMGVFGNSNSLPISLVISLSHTLKGLHWDRVPNDSDNEVSARGILYLLIFQQLGQLLRWSWGYRVLLAPREAYYKDEEERVQLPPGERYTDDPEHDGPVQTLIDTENPDISASSAVSSSADLSQFESGGATPVISRQESYSKLAGMGHPNREEDERNHPDQLPPSVLPPPPGGRFLPRQSSTGLMTLFPNVETQPDQPSPRWHHKLSKPVQQTWHRFSHCSQQKAKNAFSSLPLPLQKVTRTIFHHSKRFFHGVWEFMSPPLWAMLIAILVASVPSLQRLFFTKGTFLNNSVTRAVQQSGGVAVPLILVVLGANLARNTLPTETAEELEHPKEEHNLIIASLLARMFLPTVIMGPILALMAKFVPVSILDDPIFVIVCFLLTGAPSALQLAQICQLNNVYMGAMSRLLFQSYVVWILPSTLFLVMIALQVVRWATAS